MALTGPAPILPQTFHPPLSITTSSSKPKSPTPSTAIKERLLYTRDWIRISGAAFVHRDLLPGSPCWDVGWERGGDGSRETCWLVCVFVSEKTFICLLQKSELEELFVGMKRHIRVWALGRPWPDPPWADCSLFLCLSFPIREMWVWLL